MRREGWFLVVGSWNGAAVRVHCLAPFLALIMPGRQPSAGTVCGLLLVILVHELGHAVLIRQLGGVVHRIDVLPWGGECAHSGTTSELVDSIIAWGGVLAQAALMILALAILETGAPLQTRFAADFLWALTMANLIIAAFNLLPARGLDGAKAWLIVVLGPRWYLNKRRTGGASVSWFTKWRKRRHLRVVETPPSRKDIN